MLFHTLSRILPILLVCATLISAADPALPSLPISGGQAQTLQLRTGTVAGVFTHETISVTGQDFTAAWRISSLVTPEKPWSIQALGPITTAPKPGELVVVGVHARSVAPASDGLTRIQVMIQQNRDPWTKAFLHTLTLTPEWSHARIACVIPQGFNAETAQVGVFFGYGPQTIEIGGISYVNRGAVDPASQADASTLIIAAPRTTP
jgi:hypothetical protein